jgi:hypothetical protein
VFLPGRGRCLLGEKLRGARHSAEGSGSRKGWRPGLVLKGSRNRDNPLLVCGVRVPFAVLSHFPLCNEVNMGMRAVHT